MSYHEVIQTHAQDALRVLDLLLSTEPRQKPTQGEHERYASFQEVESQEYQALVRQAVSALEDPELHWKQFDHVWTPDTTAQFMAAFEATQCVGKVSTPKRKMKVAKADQEFKGRFVGTAIVLSDLTAPGYRPDRQDYMDSSIRILTEAAQCLEALAQLTNNYRAVSEQYDRLIMLHLEETPGNVEDPAIRNTVLQHIPRDALSEHINLSMAVEDLDDRTVETCIRAINIAGQPLRYINQDHTLKPLQRFLGDTPRPNGFPLQKANDEVSQVKTRYILDKLKTVYGK
ncbi:hypothetical protein ACFL0V_02665 [Nanoarchaeota archaeon]